MVVPDLGVDQRLVGPVSLEPVQAIGDQGGAEADAAVVRVDGEPLHEPTRPGATAHGVPGQAVADEADAEPRHRRGGDGFEQPRFIQSPEVVERQPVDVEHLWTICSAGAAESGGCVDDGHIPQVMDQQMQPFVLDKPGVEEGTLLLGVERAGQRMLDAAGGKPRTAPGDGGAVRKRTLGHRHEQGDAFVASPRADAQAGRAAARLGVRHRGARRGAGNGTIVLISLAGDYVRPQRRGPRADGPIRSIRAERPPRQVERSRDPVSLLFVSHPRFWEHDTGYGHPERPARLDAVRAGLHRAAMDEAVIPVTPRAATEADLAPVHPAAYVGAIERFCASGGGNLDGDTAASVASGEAALLAAGAGLTAIERLDAGDAGAAFCAVRPPGHHALPTRAMGFCLFNNVSVAAAHLAARGERVLIVDYDAHHGNGTQEVFWRDPRVVYVSFHEWPLYPGTGAIDDAGDGEGLGATVNFPLPAGATGDVVRHGVEAVVAPLVERWQPTWLLLSAGFDGHRSDPLAGLGLTAGDFADITADLLAFAPAGRRLVFLEGGYDLDGLAQSVGATVAALEGERYRPETPSTGGPGRSVVEQVAARRERLADSPAVGT